jgi:hypothetical protein
MDGVMTLNAMKAPDQEWLEKIHQKGVLLFGAQYDTQASEEKMLRWIQMNPGMTYRGIYSTIHWWYDIKGASIEESHGGFGIVPYVYKEAKEYYRENLALHRSFYSQDTCEAMLNPQKKDVKVKPPDPSKKSYLKGYTLS